MKYFLYSLLFILLLNNLNTWSQSKKNDIKLTISGLPLLGTSDTFKQGVYGYILKPSLGYYVSNSTSIELVFGYSTMDRMNVGGVNSYYNSYTIAPILRNNLINKKKFRLFAETGFGFGTIKYEADDKEFHTRIHDWLSGGISVFTLGFGGNYYINDKFSVELIIPYIYSKNITSNHVSKLFSGLGPTLGITFSLPSATNTE